MRNKQLSHYVAACHNLAGKWQCGRDTIEFCTYLHMPKLPQVQYAVRSAGAPSLPLSLSASFPQLSPPTCPPHYIEMHFVALPLEKANFTKISIINCSLAKCKNASKEQAKRGAWSRERGKGVGYIAIKIRLAAMQILFIKLDGEGQFHKTLAMPTAIMPANRQSGRGPSTAPTPAPLCQ